MGCMESKKGCICHSTFGMKCHELWRWTMACYSISPHGLSPIDADGFSQVLMKKCFIFRGWITSCGTLHQIR